MSASVKACPISKRPAKLLVVIGTIAHMGGAERQALYLVEHLASLPGCRVEVLTFEDGAALRPALNALGVPIHVHPYYFRWPRARRTMALLKVARLLKFKIKPDALLPFVGIHSKAMAQVWPLSGARFCWWNQQDEGRDLHGTVEEGRILRKVSCVNSNSEAGRDFLAGTYGLPPASILVYNNGTPVPDAPNISGAWRTKLDLGQRMIVSMVANITSFKDHATLIDAWVTVRQHFNGRASPVLLLAGHLREQSTVAKLKMQAFDSGLSNDDIHFLGPLNDVPGLIAESDIVVHSSLTEGCPNAVCEAMALAKAVVATDIPGCRQALGEVGARWLAEPQNPESLAAKIIQLLEDESLRTQQGKDNLERIKAEFSIAGMSRYFQDLIEKGLGVSLGQATMDRA
jgi:glycosyltransferase involved in cell wall biosynthesis